MRSFLSASTMSRAILSVLIAIVSAPLTPILWSRLTVLPPAPPHPTITIFGSPNESNSTGFACFSSACTIAFEIRLSMFPSSPIFVASHSFVKGSWGLGLRPAPSRHPFPVLPCAGQPLRLVEFPPLFLERRGDLHLNELLQRQLAKFLHVGRGGLD